MVGIYFIKCNLNKRVYIGSSVNIDQRIKRHIWLLKRKIHSNTFLQNSFNKYGLENFKFGVISLCEEKELLKYEQYYINRNKNLFNIIVDDVIRPSLQKEVRNKISKTLTSKYKQGLIKLNEGQFKKGVLVWNKGKIYSSTEHLKVPKLKKGNRDKFKDTIYKRLPDIEVYLQDKLLYTGKSLDIVKNSNNLKEYMNLRNANGRNGYSPFILQSVNILKSCKTGKPYKGLIFKFKDQVHIKQGELLGNPIIVSEDNQQPSLSSNTFEGSTTNSQILTKDSNADTSSLPIVIERDKNGKPLMSVQFQFIDFSKNNSDDIV